MFSNIEKTELIKRWVQLCPSVLVPEFRLGENVYLLPTASAYLKDELRGFACLDANFGEISRMEAKAWDYLIAHQAPPTISQWCEANGYTEQHMVERKWWAFPAGAVMPVPLNDPIHDDLFVSLSIYLKGLEFDPAYKPRFTPGEYGGFYLRHPQKGRQQC
jgi:hypothetical protein